MDVTTKEYRKVYMCYKMPMRRHPEESSYEEKFNKLTSEVKGWRNELAHKAATTEEFLAWIMESSEKFQIVETNVAKKMKLALDIFKIYWYDISHKAGLYLKQTETRYQNG